MIASSAQHVTQLKCEPRGGELTEALGSDKASALQFVRAMITPSSEAVQQFVRPESVFDVVRMFRPDHEIVRCARPSKSTKSTTILLDWFCDPPSTSKEAESSSIVATNKMWLPFYTHPGEVVDPHIMSLLLQAELEEQQNGQTRFTESTCPLFATKQPIVESPRRKRKYSDVESEEDSSDAEPVLRLPKKTVHPLMMYPTLPQYASCTSPLNQMI